MTNPTRKKINRVTWKGMNYNEQKTGELIKYIFIHPPTSRDKKKRGKPNVAI